MELIIEGIKLNRNRNPHYILTIDFMNGSTSSSSTLKVDEKEIEDLKPLILAAACCCVAYPNGRAGYDNYDGLLEYDAFFSSYINFRAYNNIRIEGQSDKEFENFINDKLEEMNPDGYSIDHPNDSYGSQSSFESYSLKYVDRNGDSSKVKIKFNEEDNKRIQFAKKHLI